MAAQEVMSTPVKLPSTTAAPGIARREIRQHASTWPVELLDAVLLLATEVVTNAVRYGEGGITILVSKSPGSDGIVRVEVTDVNPALPSPRNLHGTASAAESGRGLHLLDALTRDWGASPTATGKTVWFTVAP